MKIFYCPQCGKIDKNFKYEDREPYVINIRDGFGHPIYHIKCNCGNYLAGYMNWSEKDLQNEGLYNYIIETIKGYNLNGCFLQDEKQEEWYNYVKEKYEEQKNNKGVKIKI